MNSELKQFLKPLPLATTLLTLSAFYLIVPARDSMGWASALATLLHLALGFVVILPGALFLLQQWQEAKAEGGGKRFLILMLLATSFISAATGIYLTVVSAQGSTVAYKHLSYALHLWCGLFATCLLALHLMISRFSSGWRKRERAKSEEVAPISAIKAPLLLTIVGYTALFGTGALVVGGVLLPMYQGETYYRNLTSTTPEQAENRLFPAGLRLESSIGTPLEEPLKTQMESSQSCGRGGCHPDSLREWSPSAHHLAESDPFYSKVLNQLKHKSGVEATKWCQGCHAPQKIAAAANLEATATFGRGANSAQNSSSEGVGCLSCHAMRGTPTRTGNANFTLAEVEDYPFGEATQGWKRNLHDFLLRVRPAPHQRALLKPELHRSAEFCSSCHRQSLSVAQNHYQFVRGADDYGGWVSGAYSGRTARTGGFETKSPKTCQDCHFAKNQSGLSAHSSPGGNTALFAQMGDSPRLKAEEDFLKNRISLDILALRRKATSSAAPEEWIAPLDSLPPHLAFKPGEEVSLDIVVFNHGVGHDFPAGYADLKEAWVEVEITDSTGKRLLQNGADSELKPALRPEIHQYRTLALNRKGEPIHYAEHSEQVVSVYRKIVPSGGSDIARYRFKIPERDAVGMPISGKIGIRAYLKYRSLSPEFSRWSLGSDSKSPPVTTLATSSVVISLSSVSAQLPPIPGSEKRFIRYGFAMLLAREKPELSGAMRAFRMANLIAPKRPEPLIGLGNVYLAEPDFLSAVAQYRAALKLSPDNSAAKAALALVLSRQGQPDKALQILNPLLLRFPEDPTLQFETGLALANVGRFQDASNAFKSSLGAEPDNYGAHFQLQKWSAHLKQTAEAQRESTILSYLGEETLRTELLSRYLKKRSEAKLQLMPIPEHRLFR